MLGGRVTSPSKVYCVFPLICMRGGLEVSSFRWDTLHLSGEGSSGRLIGRFDYSGFHCIFSNWMISLAISWSDFYLYFFFNFISQYSLSFLPLTAPNRSSYLGSLIMLRHTIHHSAGKPLHKNPLSSCSLFRSTIE